jgi:hypothetical protein
LDITHAADSIGWLLRVIARGRAGGVRGHCLSQDLELLLARVHSMGSNHRRERGTQPQQPQQHWEDQHPDARAKMYAGGHYNKRKVTAFAMAGAHMSLVL